MKKYFALLSVIISGLVHAAAEPSAPAKKMNCADLARHIYSKNRSDFGVREGEEDIVDFVQRVRNGEKEKSVLRIRLMYDLGDWPIEKEENSFPCNKLPVIGWHSGAFEQGEGLAARAQEGVCALEHCVQESLEYADSPEVKETLASLKQKADLWPQCLQAQREAVAARQAQKEKEREMDEYAQQHGDSLTKLGDDRKAKTGGQHKPGVQHDPNSPRRNFFDRWFPG
jgi:hypothetical protein